MVNHVPNLWLKITVARLNRYDIILKIYFFSPYPCQHKYLEGTDGNEHSYNSLHLLLKGILRLTFAEFLLI